MNQINEDAIPIRLCHLKPEALLQPTHNIRGKWPGMFATMAPSVHNTTVLSTKLTAVLTHFSWRGYPWPEPLPETLDRTHDSEAPLHGKYIDLLSPL